MTMTTKDELRAQILKIKERLPNGYMNALKNKFPRKYNGREAKVRKVVALQSLDKGIIIDLEKIAL